MISSELQAALGEDRGFKVGTKRTWKGGEYVKTKTGWVPVAAGRRQDASPFKPMSRRSGNATTRMEPSTAVRPAAASKPEPGGKDGGKPSGALRKAIGKVSDVAKGAVRRLPTDAQKLVTDREYRAATGKKMAEALRRKSIHAAKSIVDELHELKDGAAALKKLALRQKLTKHDKRALKGAAKAIGTTIAGTILLGGISHLTAAALGTHFVAETLIKHAGRAALFADIQRLGWPIFEENDAAVQEVVERIIQKVIQDLESVGEMSDEEIADILVAYKEDDGDEEADAEGDEDEDGEDDEEGQSSASGDKEDDDNEVEDDGVKLKGERDWKPGSHNRQVDTSRWGQGED